jgi:hypothetical protein
VLRRWPGVLASPGLSPVIESSFSLHTRSPVATFSYEWVLFRESGGTISIAPQVEGTCGTSHHLSSRLLVNVAASGHNEQMPRRVLVVRVGNSFRVAGLT